MKTITICALEWIGLKMPICSKEDKKKEVIITISKSQLMLLLHISQVVSPLLVQYLMLNHTKLCLFGHL